MNEFKFELEDGTLLEVHQLKDINGNPKYLINDPSGVYTPFSWSPHMPGIGDALDASQKTVLSQLKSKIEK